MGDGGWEVFEGQDVQTDEPRGRPFPATSAEQLAACREECLRLGYGGFLVQKGSASFRPHSRQEILDQKVSSLWGRGTALHVAPPMSGKTGQSTITVVHGDAVFQASVETLSGKSGYFASLFRSAWADGSDCHSFGEFPGGEEAFLLAMAWLAADADTSVGEPWPVRECSHVCGLARAAAYLDSPGLLCSASRSWRLATARPRDQLMQVAEVIGEASLQFGGDDQEVVIGELRSILQELPKHALTLAPEFLVSPAAGLAVLEVRGAARESLYGHIKNVGSWVGSVIGASSSGERAGHGAETETHDFAIELFDEHERAFLARKSDLRQLLRHVDPALPIEAPLCFRVAAAAAAAEAVHEEEVFAGQRLAMDVFERSIGAVPDPAQAASDSACVVGLFGAGLPAAEEAPLSLEVLARPLVPPAAAAVVLSRVLSSWAIAGSHEGGEDGADVILAGVAADRQGLRSLLSAVLPRVAAESGPLMGTEWGTSFDFAVPELRAAFTSAAAAAVAAAGPRGRGTAAAPNETLRLLFRVLYQPSGGLTDVSFPLSLLAEVAQDHNPACLALAAHRALVELRRAADEEGGHEWAMAEDLWPIVCSASEDQSLVESAVEMMRTWLSRAKAEPSTWRSGAAKEAAVRLLRRLPLQQIREPEELLGPPIPAHVLACLARREQEKCVQRLSQLEQENDLLRQEVARLCSERHKSG